MKARPILMSAPMVIGCIEDRKTNTRRVIKPQPAYMFRLTDGDVEYADADGQWCGIASNPKFSEFRLHGRSGRSDLLPKALSGLWEDGLRGLVSASSSAGGNDVEDFRPIIVMDEINIPRQPDV